jgi:hypothetical protein
MFPDWTYLIPIQCGGRGTAVKIDTGHFQLPSRAHVAGRVPSRRLGHDFRAKIIKPSTDSSLPAVRARLDGPDCDVSNETVMPLPLNCDVSNGTVVT